MAMYQMTGSHPEMEDRADRDDAEAKAGGVTEYEASNGQRSHNG
jgi:hypothetical protein